MNICIISAHFPSYDVPGAEKHATSFLFQYAKEWVKQGHKVFVIDLLRTYPRSFRVIARLLSKIGRHNLSKYVLPKEAEHKTNYDYFNVNVQRFLYKKYIPHKCTGQQETKKLSASIIDYLQGINLEWDIVIGDCFDPVLQIATQIKKYTTCPYYQVVHNSDFALLSEEKILVGANNVDKWLVRSKAQIPNMQAVLNGEESDYVYMYSGIDKESFPEKPVFRTQIKDIIYVGTLIKSKGLATILYSLKKSKNKDITLSVIGSGVDSDYFINLVEQLDLGKRVVFLGQKPHAEVLEIMKKKDALALISHETFGMVYVEAMSQGCIPIGTINEGIDGVVKDGENGFLVPLEGENQLAALFDSFLTIRNEDVTNLSRCAYETAQEMTSDLLAQKIVSCVSDKNRGQHS